jgi:hypothetical protein
MYIHIQRLSGEEENEMNEIPPRAKAETPVLKPVLATEVDYLRQISDHLKSIRNMLSFFTFILVMIIIFWLLSVFVVR